MVLNGLKEEGVISELDAVKNRGNSGIGYLGNSLGGRKIKVVLC